jgi:UDP-glucuronate 4-epimerase
MSKRAIVTGSSGFIGATLSSHLLNEGWEVLGIDSHSEYYSVELKELRRKLLTPDGNFHFHNLNLGKSTHFEDITRDFKPNSIFHLAAQAGVRIPNSEAHKYVESNLVGFSNVLQTAIVNEVPNFLYASSSSVYGDIAEIPYSESERNLHPNSFYGATKLSNEILTEAMTKGSRTKSRGMRFFTVYGPMGRPDMAYFRIVASLIAGSKFELFGDGRIERDFTFIDDCVQMISKLEKELRGRPEGFSDVVNIGGGNPVSMLKLIETTNEILGKTLNYEISSANPKDVAKTMADARYLEKLIGDKPMCDIRSGIEKTVEWAKHSVTPTQLTNWVNSSR